ncbi:MAG: PHP-associated domain-containing protein [Candidatus Helarchaeota archaeon]
MLIDLHVHTYPKSKCSNMSPEECIEKAIEIGLDGLVFTEHNICWQKSELDSLNKKYDILILGGIEITTIEGDILVYNHFFDPITKLPKTQEIRDILGDSKDSFMAIAHPFREFLVVGIGDLGLDVNEIMGRPIFNILDGIEIFNGLVSRKANRLAKTICNKKNLICIGGSDAHELFQIGKYVAEFENEIKNEKDLVNELFKRNFQIKHFKK